MHTSACRKICMCNNPDRLCMAEREALKDPSLMTNNLGADYSHFKTKSLIEMYCRAVFNHCGYEYIPRDISKADVTASRDMYLKFESAKMREPESVGFFRKLWVELQANWVESGEKIKTQRAAEVADEMYQRDLTNARLWWDAVWANRWMDSRWKTITECYQIKNMSFNDVDYERLLTLHGWQHPLQLWCLRKERQLGSNAEHTLDFWIKCGKPVGPNILRHHPGLHWVLTEARDIVKVSPDGKPSPLTQKTAGTFYEALRSTLWTDPWSIILSGALGLTYIEDAAKCKQGYEHIGRPHPFFSWCAGRGLDPENNAIDRAVLFALAGKPPSCANHPSGIVNIIRLIGEPFIIELPELKKTMSKESVAKEVTLHHKSAGWYLMWEDKDHPTKLGGLPKSDVVYSNEFYNYVKGTAKIGFSLRGVNYTIECNQEFTIDTIVDENGNHHHDLSIPVGHPVLDLLMVNYPVSELTGG